MQQRGERRKEVEGGGDLKEIRRQSNLVRLSQEPPKNIKINDASTSRKKKQHKKSTKK
jgi:hypothetical protein